MLRRSRGSDLDRFLPQSSGQPRCQKVGQERLGRRGRAGRSSGPSTSSRRASATQPRLFLLCYEPRM